MLVFNQIMKQEDITMGTMRLVTRSDFDGLVCAMLLSGA